MYFILCTLILLIKGHLITNTKDNFAKELNYDNSIQSLSLRKNS